MIYLALLPLNLWCEVQLQCFDIDVNNYYLTVHEIFSSTEIIRILYYKCNRYFLFLNSCILVNFLPNLLWKLYILLAAGYYNISKTKKSEYCILIKYYMTFGSARKYEVLEYCSSSKSPII